MQEKRLHSQARFLFGLVTLFVIFTLTVSPAPVQADEETDSSDEAAESSEFDWLFEDEFLRQPQKPALTYSLGVTYDYLSQTFYLLESVSDTLEVVSQLNQEYLNQPALFLEGRFKPMRDEALQFVGYGERSDELFRGRVESIFRSRNPASQFSGEVLLEGRSRHSGLLEFGDEYALGRARLKYRARLGSAAYGYLSARGEIHRLGSTPDDVGSSLFTGDYEKGGAEAGLEFDVGQLDRLSVSGSLQRRTVKERADLNYRLGRMRLDYSGFSGSSIYALEFSFENRDYDSAGDDNDQRQYDFGASGEFRVGSGLYFEGGLRLESVDYLLDSASLSIDQTLFDSEFKLMRRWGLTTFGFGIGLSQLSQKDQSSANRPSVVDLAGSVEEFSEEYIERAAIFSFEHFKLSRIMITLENQFGFRNVEFESEYQSDYWFDRITLFSSLNLSSRIKFDLIGSLDLEWHDQASDDNALYLLNTAISYNFN